MYIYIYYGTCVYIFDLSIPKTHSTETSLTNATIGTHDDLVVKTPCFNCRVHGFNPVGELRSHMSSSVIKINLKKRKKNASICKRIFNAFLL